MAAPNPERELARLRKVLDGGLPKVTLVLGPATWFRGSAVDLLLAAVPKNHELRIVDGEQKSDGRELELVEGGLLFGAGAVLAIRRGEDWLKAHGPALERTLTRLCAHSSVVLEVQKLDRRTKLGKSLTERAAVFEFRELYAEPYDRARSPLEAELVAWIVERGRALQLQLTPEAAFLLLSIVGKEPAELVAELERLRGQVGAKAGRLGPDDLRGKLTAAFASTPFELAEALLDLDRRRCERSLEAMFARGVRDRDGGTMERGGLFPFITSWLYTSLANAHLGRCLLDAGVPLPDVPAQVGVRAFADRFMAQVAKNTEPRLRRGLVLLIECQRQLRLTGEDAELLLQQFLAGCFEALP